MSAVTAPVPPEGSRLRATGPVRRRKLTNRVAELAGWLAAAIACGALLLLVGSVLLKGIPALDLNLLTNEPVTGYGEKGGGIANAIIGSLLIVGVAAAMAVPFGVMVAIYVSEFARGRVGRVVRLGLDVLNGFPSIVIGIFIYALLVVGRGQNAFLGSLALAIIMVPLVARATGEVLALVPAHLREGSFALGVARWRTTLFVVLPTVAGGVLTGSLLAVARAAGETAPLLFASSLYGNSVSVDMSKAMASIPLTIFVYSESPDTSLNEQAWAAAFLLIMFVLVLNVVARLYLARSRRKIESR